MSAGGPSRHLATASQIGRFRGKAEIERQAKPAELVENDPKLISDLRRRPLRAAEQTSKRALIRSVPIYDEVDASAETIPPVVDGLGGRRLVV